MNNDLHIENYQKSPLLVEQHFHGVFGVDFANCTVDELLSLSKKLLTCGIGGFFPTLVTDTCENIKKQIEVIKEAKSKQTPEMADILGIHLEGIFINPQKKGIHDENLFLKPTIENYKKVEDDFIKIVTLAPELDEDNKLQKYLTMQGVKVQAGHCVGGDLACCHGTTHTFNAMASITHRASSTALSALLNDNLYSEIIADGVHLSEEIVSLVFKTKPKDKIILVSDSLPIAQSDKKEMQFAGQTVYYDGEKATGKDGTLAGSTAILNKIVKSMALKNPDNFENIVRLASENVLKYHDIKLNGYVWWDEDFNIVAVEKDGVVLQKDC